MACRHGHLDLRGEISPVGGSCIMMANILVSPASCGSVRLSSAFPLDPPLLDPGLFTNPLGEKMVYECTRMTSTAIQNSSTVSKYGAVEYTIDEELRGDLSDQALRK